MASGGVVWGTCRKQAFASFLEDSCGPVERSARAGVSGQHWLWAPKALEAWESPSPKPALSASYPHCRSGFCPVLFWPLLEPEPHLGQKWGQEEPSQRQGLSAASPKPGHRVGVAAAPCLPSSCCHPLPSFQPHWGHGAASLPLRCLEQLSQSLPVPGTLLPQHRLSWGVLLGKPIVIMFQNQCSPSE